MVHAEFDAVLCDDAVLWVRCITSLPKAAQRPVFSYKLYIVQFWSLVFLGVWVGPHELIYTSTASWVSLLGMAFSLMLWMPNWAGVINGLSTLRGAWREVVSNPVLKFFAAGLLFFGVWTFESSLFSLRSVNAFSGYTDWAVAHLHFGSVWLGRFHGVWNDLLVAA